MKFVRGNTHRSHFIESFVICQHGEDGNRLLEHFIIALPVFLKSQIEKCILMNVQNCNDCSIVYFAVFKYIKNGTEEQRFGQRYASLRGIVKS